MTDGCILLIVNTFDLFLNNYNFNNDMKNKIITVGKRFDSWIVYERV